MVSYFFINKSKLLNFTCRAVYSLDSSVASLVLDRNPFTKQLSVFNSSSPASMREYLPVSEADAFITGLSKDEENDM